MNYKKINSIKNWLGPKSIRLFQKSFSFLIKPRLKYAPNGWNTKIEGSSAGWNDKNIIQDRINKYHTIKSICESIQPLAFSCEADLSDNRNVYYHNLNITFGYILALAAHKKERISILDWGGGIGHFYYISKALLPEIEIDYYCVEVPQMVSSAKSFNKDITWFFDDSYLQKKYDLVFVNASLQYVREWKTFLKNISLITEEYFFLTRIPVVLKSETFVAIQSEGNEKILHQQFNKSQLIGEVINNKFKLLREFIVGDKPYIHKAPEQCELLGWLFKKEK